MNLSSLGWDDAFARQFQHLSDTSLFPARVAVEHKQAYVLFSARGEFTAACTGRLLHTTTSRADLPAVGDWVAVRPRPGETHADIHAVLPRRTKFSRRAAGDTAAEQVVAANIDTVLLVVALDQNFNLRRIERYLTVAWESGAQPVVVLNKSDLHANPAAARNAVESIAPGTPVVTVSATQAEGLGQLTPWLLPGRTLALLGSSGVGKSTLINRLSGTDHQRTGDISDAVGKGRHTTTHRELMVAPAGWLVIDTPGMRELQFWDVAAGALDATFVDVTSIIADCRFSDCTHRHEPGCAVQSALDRGELSDERWRSYQKLQREQAHAARQADPRLARANREQWKRLHRQARAVTRFKERGDED